MPLVPESGPNPSTLTTEFFNITSHTINVVRCLRVMSDSRAKHMEGIPVDVPHLDGHREDNSLTWWDEIPWVTTPVDVGGLADSLLRVSIRSPLRGTSEDPTTNVSHEVDELDVGPHRCLYCLQLDVVMVQDPLRYQRDTTSPALMDGCYHKGHGSRRCP